MVVGGSYPSAEVQSEYSTAPADWTIKKLITLQRFIVSNSSLVLFMLENFHCVWARFFYFIKMCFTVLGALLKYFASCSCFRMKE